MAAMALHLRAYDPDAGQATAHPLPLDGAGAACTVTVRTLPGASGLHLAFVEDGEVRQRVEIGAEGDEEVRVHVERDEEGQLHLASTGRQLLTLPADPHYEPPLPLRPTAAEGGLDLALVVDGTVRAFAKESGRLELLLDDRKRWRRHVGQLMAWLGELTRDAGEVRLALLAFGDQAPPRTSALDLRPAYLLYPEDPRQRDLRAEPLADLEGRLLALPASSGGDFVDALGDALKACGELRWREEARKILLVTGDSPGHSLLHPAPWGADAGVRHHDVEHQALDLHRRTGLGLEIATLYHDLPVESGHYDLATRRFLDHARDQYRRLASRPETAWLASTFDPEAAAATLRTPLPALGRGPCLGVVVAVQAG